MLPLKPIPALTLGKKSRNPELIPKATSYLKITEWFPKGKLRLLFVHIHASCIWYLGFHVWQPASHRELQGDCLSEERPWGKQIYLPSCTGIIHWLPEMVRNSKVTFWVANLKSNQSNKNWNLLDSKTSPIFSGEEKTTSMYWTE